jgi:hypothetical protein
MTNVVSGSTAGGALTLTQIATGGAGGNTQATAAGGNGGAATSSLTFDDVTTNTKHASSVTGTVGAYGGAGGSGAPGGAGGAATASLTLTGARAVTASSTATGGAGGAGGFAGNATATTDAIGTTSITSKAMATGVGRGTATATAIGQGAHGGKVSAIAIGQGVSGTADATASTSLSGSLVTAAESQASAPVAGTSTSLARSAIGQGRISAPAFVTDQSEAQITAEPTSADVNSILTANSNISAAFSTTPTYFGVAELGGVYSTSVSGSETETSSVQMTVDLTKAGTLHDLLIGFYGGTSAGAGFTSMSLDVKVNGTDHKLNFTTVAAANTFFQDHAKDYGLLSGTSLQLDISLSITESAAGGYDFGMLIGDPPAASEMAAHHNLVAAMATFGTNASGSSGTFTAGQQDDRHAMLAAHSV